ncbi:acyl-CoA N-acyltransferase [Coprinopsis sp. MPI-PUGE-AT-0042]|nr:acyl-CoA N-acyltransferase [Coprinopsis sp. MPI-PUGE-AT-0042]
MPAGPQVPESQESSPSNSPSVVLYSPDKRIRLARPTSAEDEQVAALRSDPRTLRFLPFAPKSASVQEVAELREKRSKNPARIDFNAFDDSPEGGAKFVGGTGAFDIDDLHHSCEVGIAVTPEATGKGVCTSILYTLLKYMFEEKGIHRVSFETAVDNAPMRGWLEKVAEARLEATRADCWTDCEGGWTTAIGYAILDHEWRDRIKGSLEKRLGVVSTKPDP